MCGLILYYVIFMQELLCNVSCAFRILLHYCMVKMLCVSSKYLPELKCYMVPGVPLTNNFVSEIVRGASNKVVPARFCSLSTSTLATQKRGRNGFWGLKEEAEETYSLYDFT